MALLDTFSDCSITCHIFQIRVSLDTFSSRIQITVYVHTSFKLPYTLILFQDRVHFANWHPCIHHDDLVAIQTSILPLHTMHTHACFLIYSLMMYVCFNAVPRFKQWMIVCLAGLQSRGCNGIVFEGDLAGFAANLPTSPPGFAPQSYVEMSEQWKASPLPTKPVELFIGILSAVEAWRFQMQNSRSPWH